ncbi:TonB-dependent vitamin B12 receptor [Pseudoluteimonas lycopersici]|uniref:TonB-dependent vitamin B12 receptor n=1 Tax=Pseudoluteimonas lycopersici TaxID=1324796 RepID=A0A516V5H3_9GAMM|nr:TonB-dependent vitamin B12 receptor [Lysobacter lycopersici]QDQ73780.1 TonB-dependent vitamin B12 receptor [Lysobacter lycopersici]
MHLRSLSFAIALALPAVASAQTASDLDQVVVTATRTESSVADSLFPVQVIERDDIERSQARSLPDLLRGRAGIDFGNQGGLGKLSTLFLRGTESDQVLVLVDGVRIGSATAGLVSFQDIPVDQIDRIEIVRGPRSSLYGSEAVGGVIQVFTRHDQGAFTPRFRVGIGSNKLREASAGIGGGNEHGWYGADFAWQRTDGINACNGSATLFAGCFVDEPDRDGYRNASLNLRGGVDLGETVKLEAHALRAEAFNEYDGSIYGGNEADNVQQAMSAKLEWTPSQRVAVSVQAGRSDDDSDNSFNDHAGTTIHVGNFDTHRTTASLQGDFGLAEGQSLSAGADWQRDRIDSNTDFDITARDNTGVYVEYLGKFGAQQLQASVRNDDNEQFGSHATGSLGWGMAFGDGFKLMASYGTAFKAPTFNDLYYPFFGNPDLKPETSRSANIGISQHAQRWSWTLDAYETRIDDLISYDSSIFLPNNIDKARIRGVEFTVDTTLAGWDIGVQLSHTDPRSESGSTDGNLLARRARNTGRIDLDRAFGAFRFGATLNGSGPRYDDAANSVRLGGFATTDLRFEYAFDNDWTLQVRATNVFDRHYETVAWYNQPGREFGLSLRYAPN